MIYKRKFKESTEYIPYEVYGRGDLNYFLSYFVDKYNKIYKTKYSIQDIDISIKEIKNKNIDKVNQGIQRKIQKYFEIALTNKETYNYLYNGILLLSVDFSNKDIITYLTWNVNEKSPIGKIEQVSFIFGK